MAATNSSNSVYAVATSATYVIVSSLNVSVSTDKPSYTRNQTVTITAIVSGDGLPASGAGVTFTIMKPNGAKVTGTATTGSSGSAVYQYRPSRKDPTGTYQITINANLGNAIFGSGWKNFTVQ